jgi:hypothetical protein
VWCDRIDDKADVCIRGQLCITGKQNGVCVCTDPCRCCAGKYGTATGQTTEASCTACPSNSTSPAGSAALTSCTCNAGSTGPDGGNCTACVAGKYKTSAGSALCSDCPTNSTSPAGSTSLTHCTSNVALNKPVTASSDYFRCYSGYPYPGPGATKNCAGSPRAYDSSGSGLLLDIIPWGHGDGDGRAGNPVTNGDGQASVWHAADNDNTNFLILDLGQDFSAIENMVTTKNSGSEWFGWKRVTIEIKSGSQSSWQPVRTDSTSYRFSNYKNYQFLLQVDQLYIQLLYEITAYLHIHMCFL